MKKEKCIDTILIVAAVTTMLLTFARVFFGTEITDESYYISEAIQMIRGNIPYAYNNFSFGTGFPFLTIPFVFVYELFVPNDSGIMLFTRICFILFWFSVIWCGYFILKKYFGKRNSLAVSLLLIPYTPGPTIFNFSYNTIPCALSYLSGIILYDAIEGDGKGKRIKILVTGFMMCIAVLAQPGYGLAALTFLFLIIFRTKKPEEKLCDFLLFASGAILNLLVVFVPIVFQMGADVLIDGILALFFPYADSIGSTVKKPNLVMRFCDAVIRHKKFIPLVIIGVLIALVILIVLKRKKMLSKGGYWIMLLSILISGTRMLGNDYGCWRLGIVGSLFCIFFFFRGHFLKYPILLYLGVYPILFSAGEMIAVNSNALLSRFTAAVPTLVVCFLIFLNTDSKIKIVSYTSVMICVFFFLAGKYSYVYRDEGITELDTKVESGVFKGIFTTEERAKDLPMCEEYLNSIVNDGDSYAGRDNVPFAYLMIHQGKMIEKSTWDCLQYTKGKNNPANLYSYYKRRDAIPDLCIYIDYGRDGCLSIDTDDYKYNDFVNSFYELKEKRCLNSTFWNVLVYENNGKFDGNYDELIEKSLK